MRLVWWEVVSLARVRSARKDDSENLKIAHRFLRKRSAGCWYLLRRLRLLRLLQFLLALVSNVTLNETVMEEFYGEDSANTFGEIFGELDCEECSCACELDPGTVAWVAVCCLVPVILLLACCWCCGCCCFSRRRRSPHAQV